MLFTFSSCIQLCIKLVLGLWEFKGWVEILNQNSQSINLRSYIITWSQGTSVWLSYCIEFNTKLEQSSWFVIGFSARPQPVKRQQCWGKQWSGKKSRRNKKIIKKQTEKEKERKKQECNNKPGDSSSSSSLPSGKCSMPSLYIAISLSCTGFLSFPMPAAEGDKWRLVIKDMFFLPMIYSVSDHHPLSRDIDNGPQVRKYSTRELMPYLTAMKWPAGVNVDSKLYSLNGWS